MRGTPTRTLLIAGFVPWKAGRPAVIESTQPKLPPPTQPLAGVQAPATALPVPKPAVVNVSHSGYGASASSSMPLPFESYLYFEWSMHQPTLSDHSERRNVCAMVSISNRQLNRH